MRLAAVVYEYRNQDLRKLIVDASKPSARPAPTAPKVSYLIDKLSSIVYIVTFVSGFLFGRLPPGAGTTSSGSSQSLVTRSNTLLLAST